jgi:hypothetical protein
MTWKARASGSFVSAAACILFTLAPTLDQAQVPPTSGAGVLLGTDAYGHSAASPIGWDVYSVEGLQTLVGAPFSGVATTQFASRATDGRRSVQTKSVWYYRDGQGRVRVDLDFGTGHPESAGSPHNFEAGSVLIIDHISGKRYMLFPLKRTAAVLSVRGPTTAAPLRPPVPTPDVDISFSLPGHGPKPPDAAAETVALGEKKIDGIKVVGSRRVHVISVGDLGNGLPITVTAEQWFSPELGVVVEHSETSSIGSRMDEMTSRLHTVIRAEPDPALFTVPSDFKQIEVDPRGPPPPRPARAAQEADDTVVGAFQLPRMRWPAGMRQILTPMSSWISG